MDYESAKNEFERAIRSKRKVHLQMSDTPDDKSILFKPYAILTDKWKENYVCFGFIEKHYNTDKENYPAAPVISSIKRPIKSIAILNETFTPKANWKDEVKEIYPESSVEFVFEIVMPQK